MINVCHRRSINSNTLNILRGVAADLSSEKINRDEAENAVKVAYQNYLKDSQIDDFNKLLNQSGLSEYNFDYKQVLQHVPQLSIKELDFDNLFKTFDEADSAYTHVVNLFTQGIFKYTFLNKEKSARIHYVHSAEDFNNGIIDFKNNLVNIIQRKLQLPETKLFDKNGGNAEEYNRLMSEIKSKFLNNFDVRGQIEGNESDFSVFSAVYILNNFDRFIIDNLDGVVSVNSNLAGDLNNTTYAYQVNKKGTSYWLNDTHEDKNSEKFISNITKFITGQIPKVQKVKYNGKYRIEKIPGRFMDTSELFLLSGVLKQAEFEYNLLHPNNKINFLRDTKKALRTLLTLDDVEINRIPVLRDFEDQVLTLGTFLYQDTDDEFSIKTLYSSEFPENGKLLDIEGLFAFEISKTVAPSYVQYDKDGRAKLINHSQSFDSSQKLIYNIENLLYTDADSEHPILDTKGWFNKSELDKLTIAQLKQDQIFQTLFSELFDVANIANVKTYDDFIKENKSQIISLLIAIHDKKLKSGLDQDTKITQALKAAQELQNLVPNFIDFKRKTNKFFIDTPRTIFKDSNNNSIPIYRLNSAMCDDSYLIEQYQLNSSNSNQLNFFVENPNTLSRVIKRYTSDGKIVQSFNDKYKNSTIIKLDGGEGDNIQSANKFSVPAQVVASYIGDFLDLQTSADSIAVQIACYSDKSSIMMKVINLLSEIYDPTTRKIVKLKDIMTSDSLLQLDYYYRKNQTASLMQSIIKDWAVVAEKLGKPIKILDESNLNKILNNTESIHPKNTEDLFKLWKECDKFVNSLTKEEWKKVSQIASENKLELADELHYSKYADGYRLNKSILLNASRLKSLETFKNYSEQEFKKFADYKVNYGSKESNIFNTLLLRVKNLHEKDSKFASWLFPKNSNGSVSNYLDNKKFEESLRTYVYFTNFIRHQYLDLTTKEPYLDPAKGKVDSDEKELSLRLDASQKRMVIFPGTVENYLQNSLRGVNHKFNVAIVSDPEEKVFNTRGEEDNQKIFDGASYISPYESRMENESLIGKGATGTKKTLGMSVHKNVSSLYKWAEFPITNWKMKNSKGAYFDMENVFKKMHNIPFNLDLTTDFFGDHIVPSKFTDGRDIYWKKGFRYYKLKDWKFLGDHQYKLIVDKVDKNGNKIDIAPEYDLVSINTIYDLWKVLGGYNSMELLNGVLEDSEINHDFIYELIVNVGEYDGSGEFDQTSVRQPLRDKMIHILATKGSIKRGIINLNSVDLFTDDSYELSYFQANSALFGQQLDANHEADQAEITELSQTISALAALGHTRHYADQAYKEISRIIEDSIKNHTFVLDTMSIKQKDKLFGDISKKLIKALSKDRKINLAQSIIQDLLEESLSSGQNPIIPFSDPNFYKNLTKEILSNLNKTSLKRKYMGLAGILNPASNILQLYRINGNNYLFSDLLKLADNLPEVTKLAIEDYAIPRGLDISEIATKVAIVQNTNNSLIIQSDIDVESIIENYGKMEGCGLVREELANIMIGDWVFEDGISKRLNDLYSYSNFVTKHKQDLTGLKDVTKPSDLRPQIATWTVRSIITKEINQLNQWQTEGALINAYFANIIEQIKKGKYIPQYDQNKQRLFTPQEIYIAQFLKYVQFKTYDENLKKSIDKAWQGYLKNDLYSAKQIKKLLELITIREAELLANKRYYPTAFVPYDFTNKRYNFDIYFGGLDLTKPIENNNLEEFSVIDNYVVHPAEVVMPKLFRSNYNLGKHNLSEINKDFFKKTRAFYKDQLKQDGLNVDLLIRSHNYTLDIVVLDKLSDSSQYGEEYKPQLDSNKEWVLNNNGNRLFKVPETDQYKFTLYKNKMVLILKNSENIQDTISSILESVEGMVSIQPFFDNIAKNHDTSSLLSHIISLNEIDTYNEQLSRAKKLKGDALINQLNTIYKTSRQNYENDLSNTLYQSFVKTLKIIATRIPTQALQSFMEMQVAAFNEDESNDTFVSRWQLWLQGSDLDIDKVYMMGYDVNSAGFVQHWSSIANYRSEELAQISDELPIPNGLVINYHNPKIKTGQELIPIKVYPSDCGQLVRHYLDTYDPNKQEEIRIEYGNNTNAATRLNIVKQILDYIDINKEFSIDDTLVYTDPHFDDLIRLLNRHNRTEITQEASKNLVAKNIHKVIIDPRNFQSSYSPIDRAMALFMDQIEKLEDSGVIHSYDDIISIMSLQLENSVGKDDVGIMANGLKVFFNMTQYFNKYFNQNRSQEEILRSRQFFLRRFNLNYKDSAVQTNPITKGTISDIQMEESELKFLNQIFSQLLPEYYAKGERIAIPNDDASLLISSLVSLATDNAKTLALSKIKAGLELASMHVYLTIMGFTPKEIVSYTTSPIFEKVTDLLNGNVFDGISGRFNSRTWKQLQKWAKDNDRLDEYNQFKQLYDCAQELKQFASILGINQGVKADDTKAANFIYKFQNILKQKINNYSEYIKDNQFTQTLANALVKNSGFSSDQPMIQYYLNKINNINRLVVENNIDLSNLSVNMNRYFADQNYREIITDIYDLVKSTFNIYDMINNSPNFYSMLKAFNVEVQQMSTLSAKARISMLEGPKYWDKSLVDNTYVVTDDEDPDNQTEQEMYNVSFNYGDREVHRAQQFVEDYIISQMLLNSDTWNFKFKTSKGKLYFINYKNNNNIEQFSEFVNEILIPELKRQNPNSEFLRNLVLNMADARTKNDKKLKQKQVSYVLNFNLDRLNPKSKDSLKADQIIGDFKRNIQDIKLKDIFPNNDLTNGDLTVGDILYLYNMVTKLNNFGQNSLTRIFENYVKKPNSVYKTYRKFVIDYDKGKEISIDQKKFMAFILRSQVKFNRRAKGIVKFKGEPKLQINTNVYLINLPGSVEYNNDAYTLFDEFKELVNKNMILFEIICE